MSARAKLLAAALAVAGCGPPPKVVEHAAGQDAFRADMRAAYPLGSSMDAFRASMKASHFHCKANALGADMGPHLWCQHCELRDDQTTRFMWQVVAFERGGAISRLDADQWSYPLVALRDVCE